MINEHNCSVESWFRAVFDFHFYADARFDNTAEVGRRLQSGAYTHVTACQHRLSELEFFNTVVYLHLQVANINKLFPMVWQKRHCKVAMGYGAVKRRFGAGALNIGVNPLVVERNIGKLVYLLLRYLLPFRYANYLSLQCFQLFEVFNNTFLSCFV